MMYKNRRTQGYFIGSILSIAVLIFLFLPSSKTYLIKGPLLPGHEKLECNECHKDERGTFRQQIQTNIQYLFNKQNASVSVGLRPVGNSECIKCHDRPNDRHPIYRFREPKYRQIREKIRANTCITCHLEHQNKRITVKMGFCMHCHDELNLKNDPIDISHQQLIQDKNWNSCLTCHDFHGNHEMKTEVSLDKGVPLPQLQKYFNRGLNPYPGKIIHKAKNNEKE